MKYLIYGLISLILGVFIMAFLTHFLGSGGGPDSSYLSGISFSILYLSSVIVVCTYKILSVIDKEKKEGDN